MIYLLIDTSTNNLIISVCKDNEILSELIRKNDTNLSTDFTTLVYDTLIKASMTVEDINTIFVSNGPGSFTGIRVGLTFAKVLAWSKNIKVVPFSSLELLASGIDSGHIVSFLDARRGYVYGGIYDSKLNSLVDDSYIKFDDLISVSKNYNDVSYVSFDKINNDTCLPKYDIIKVINKHKGDKGVNPHQLNPHYLKKTEAEEKLV